MANYVKFMRGTTAAYNKLTEKDQDTLYFLSDDAGQEGSLYLGTKLIAGPENLNVTSSLGQLADVMLTQGLDYDAILMYDSIEMKWRDYSFDALTFRAATESLEGAAGFVPAPAANERNKFLRGDGTWATVGLENQIFDSIKTSINQSHESALEQHTADFILNKGDIAIIQDFIIDGKYQYTSYVYNGIKWCAMDGNYNAENVYFQKDFIFTEPVGTIDIPESGSIEVAAAGKNIKEFIQDLFAQEKNPEIIQPYLLIDTPQSTSYEIGTEIIPAYIGSYNEGSYEFNTSTGVEASNWKAIDSNGVEREGIENSFDALIVDDNTNYWIQLQATLSNGIIPMTNLNNEYIEGQIKESIYTVTSSLMTGYRKTFWGALDNKDNLTSDIIRNKLSSSNDTYINGKSFNIDIPKGTIRVIIAYPYDLRDLTMVLDRNDANTNIVSAFKKEIMQIEGANNYNAIDYKVYILDFAYPYDTVNKFKVMI